MLFSDFDSFPKDVDWDSYYDEIDIPSFCDLDEESEQRLLDVEIERHIFKSIPGHGYNAPAFRKDLDNMKMIELRRKGWSLRKIAEKLNCSPNTVRNRLKHF